MAALSRPPEFSWLRHLLGSPGRDELKITLRDAVVVVTTLGSRIPSQPGRALASRNGH